MLRHHLVTLAIGVVCVSAALLIEWTTTPGPAARELRLEVFRYGIAPSVIRVNRGDRLRMTFSSRDTGHSFFLQDYRLDAKISPQAEFLEVFDPLQAEEAPRLAKAIEITAGLSGITGQLTSISRHRCHVYCGPMHGFEQGDLIVRPNWLFALSAGLVVAIPLASWYRVRNVRPTAVPERRPFDLLASSRILKSVVRWRGLQFAVTTPVLAAFLVVILAGLLGTKVGGRNLAVMATWVVWMFIMAVILMPINSRLWCLICPLPVLGEYVQRGSTVAACPSPDSAVGNRFLGLGWRWPRWLHGAWLRQLAFLSIGTIAASFAGMPRWTATLLLVLGGLAAIMSVFWQRRAFCQQLCPVTSFLGVYSGAGRLAVRARDRGVCIACRGKDCYHGNANGWGCPFNLFPSALKDNAECGLCTECFKSCPYENMTLRWRRGPILQERFHSRGQAWQALAMLTLAIAYSVVILSPWPSLRDVVNIVDRGHWPKFLAYVAILWSTTLVVVPGAFWLLNRWGLRRSGLDMRPKEAFARFAPAFVPLGLGLWVAFFTVMFMVNYRFVLMTLSDPFGWGWNLLGTAGMPWVQLWPAAIPWIQAALLLVGLAWSLRHGYRLWLAEAGRADAALRGFLPTAGMLVSLTAGMIVYFTQF
jgi:polyferredoxin